MREGGKNGWGHVFVWEEGLGSIMLSGGTLEQWGVQPLSQEGDRKAWDGGKEVGGCGRRQGAHFGASVFGVVKAGSSVPGEGRGEGMEQSLDEWTAEKWMPTLKTRVSSVIMNLEQKQLT